MTFRLKNYPEGIEKFQWIFIQEGVDRTDEVKNTDPVVDNFSLNIGGRFGNMKLKVKYGDKETAVILNVVKEEFNLVELYARHKGKRIAKSGETLYLVDGNATASTQQIRYDVSLTRNLEKGRYEPMDLIWSYIDQTKNKNSQQEFGTTYIDRTLKEENEKITTTVQAGYPEKISKSVDVQWVDGSIQSFSFVPPATSAVLTKTFHEVENNLKLMDKVLNVSGVEFKVEPIKMTGKRFNKEDEELRLYEIVEQGSISGGASAKLYDKTVTHPALAILSRAGVADVGLYVSFSFGCYLTGGVERYKYIESNNYIGNNPFIDFSPKGCLEAGLKAKLLIGSDLVDIEIRGYAQGCLAGQLKYNFDYDKFNGRIYLPPVVLGGKVKIKTKGTLEFELVDWNSSISVTDEYTIYAVD